MSGCNSIFYFPASLSFCDRAPSKHGASLQTVLHRLALSALRL